MNLLAVIPAMLLFLLEGPCPYWLADVSIGILGTDHESNLTGWIGGNASIGVLGNGEDLTASLLEGRDELEMQPLVLRTLRGDHTTIPQGVMEELEVWLLEKSFGRTFGVTGIGDDDVEFVLAIGEVLEAIRNMNLDLVVVEAGSHPRKEFLRETDDTLVNINQNGFLDTFMLDNLPENTTITSSNDQYLLRVGMRHHGKMSDHLLVSELISLSTLNDVVEDEDGAIVATLEDKDVLVFRLLVV